jgi:hypothetical protein
MRRPTFYILDGHEPVALTGPNAVHRWARWFEGALGLDSLEARRRDKRQVAFTDLAWATVSTVFLGIDHRFFSEDGPPVLFETMIFANPRPDEAFPGELDGMMRRYATWDEAEAGHEEMVAEVRQRFWRKEANSK